MAALCVQLILRLALRNVDWRHCFVHIVDIDQAVVNYAVLSFSVSEAKLHVYTTC